MIMPLSRLNSLRTDVVEHYPDLAVLQRSVKSADWSGISAYFQQLPARADQSVAVGLVAKTAGSEQLLQRVVDAEHDSALARTLLGARFVVIGWRARGAQLAKYVSRTQWTVFFDYIQRAERLLADATAIDPTNAAAWTERVTLARALGLGLDEGRRRYEKAAEHCDAPYSAQAALVQNLCPKWGGSTDEMHAFARECLKTSKPGSLGGAIVADAHFEHAVEAASLDEFRSYLGERGVRDELVGAAAQTVLHPDHEAGHGWVSAQSVFAYVFFHGGNLAQAAPHFAAMGNKVSPHPWDVIDRRWKAAFRRARNKVRKR